MNVDPLFSSVVFAGGGNRCLWQVGFWERVAPELTLTPKTIAAVSAGASMACLILCGRITETLEYFQKMTAGNPHNIYPANIFRGHPVFPHLAMYRRALLDVIDDHALETLRTGPEIRILLSRPPAWAGPKLATFIGFLCYSVEKKLYSPVHPTFSSRIGFTPEVVTIDACNSPEEVADLLLQSSCTPPFTPVMYRNGRPVLDGGLIDNVPVKILDENEKNVLVLLTRFYPPEKIPHIRGRLYVQPSQPIEVDKWDYTNPKGLRDAYDLGRHDGKIFIEQIKRTPTNKLG